MDTEEEPADAHFDHHLPTLSPPDDHTPDQDNTEDDSRSDEFYAILNLPKTVSTEDIIRRYKQLASSFLHFFMPVSHGADRFPCLNSSVTSRSAYRSSVEIGRRFTLSSRLTRIRNALESNHSNGLRHARRRGTKDVMGVG